jgi:hypothetical protein
VAKEVNVIARNGTISRFTVKDGSRKEIEEAIAEKLKDKELVWDDDDGGITVVCVRGDDLWRPRRRFFSNDDANKDGEE